MHDLDVPADDYVWPTCVACGRDLWEIELDRRACRPCEERTAKRITELPGLYRQLDTTAALMKGGRRQTAGSSGTRTAPIPARVDVLAMIGPGGIAARLQSIEDSWRQALGWPTPPATAPRTVYPVWRDTDGARRVGEAVHGDRVYPYWRLGHAAEAVPRTVTFLANNLLWACSSYDSVADDIEELRRLHGECMALVADERRPGRVQIGNCPVLVGDEVCWQPLTARADSHRVHCGTCGGRWETLGEWRDLRAAQERVLAEAAGAAA